MNLHTRYFHIAFLVSLLVSTGCTPQINAQGRSIYDNGVEWVDDYFLNLSPDARVIDYPYVYTKVSYGLQLSRIVQGQDSVWLETLDLVNGYDYNNRWPVSFAVGENLVAWGYEFLHIACRNGDSLEKLYEGEVSGNPVHFFRQITPDSLLLYDSGIISLHDPSNPEVLWESPFFMECQQIIVDTFLLYSTEEHLFIYDITNPRDPVSVDTLDGAWGQPYYSHTKPQRIGNTVGFFVYDRANFIRFTETPGEYETYEWRPGFPSEYTCFWGGVVHDSLFAFAAFRGNQNSPIHVQYFDPDRPLNDMDLFQVAYNQFYHPNSIHDDMFAEDWAVDDTLLLMGRSYAARNKLYSLADLHNADLLVDTTDSFERPYLFATDEHMGFFQYGDKGYLNFRTVDAPEFTIPSITLEAGRHSVIKDSLHLAIVAEDTARLYEITTDSVVQRCEMANSRYLAILPHDTHDLVASTKGDSISIFLCEDDTAVQVYSTRWNNEPYVFNIVGGDSILFVRFDLTLTSWILNDDMSLTFVDSIESNRYQYSYDLKYDYPYVGMGNSVFCLDDSYHFVDHLFFPPPPGLDFNNGVRDIEGHKVAVLFTGRTMGTTIVVFDISERSVTDTLAFVQYGDQYSALDGDTLWVSSNYCLSKYVLTEFNDVPESNPWSNDTAVPIMFELLSAWPNPFNSTVSIPFTLPTSCAVVVSVHDILGRQVALVTDEVYPSGYNVVRFSPTSLSSGTYFATLSTPFSFQTRRLILVK